MGEEIGAAVNAFGRSLTFAEFLTFIGDGIRARNNTATESSGAFAFFGSEVTLSLLNSEFYGNTAGMCAPRRIVVNS